MNNLRKTIWIKRVTAGILLFWAAAFGGGASSAWADSLITHDSHQESAAALWKQFRSRLNGGEFPALDVTFDHKDHVSLFGKPTHRKLEIKRGPEGVFRYASERIGEGNGFCTRISWNGSKSVTYFGMSADLPVVDGIFRIGDQRISGLEDVLDQLLFPLTALKEVDDYQAISLIDDTLIVGLHGTPRLSIHFVSPEVLAYDQVQYFDVNGDLLRIRRVTGWSMLSEIMVPSAGEDRDGGGKLLEEFTFTSIGLADLRYDDFILSIPYCRNVLVQNGTHRRPVVATELDANRLAAKEYGRAFEANVLAQVKP